jgi:hypothetical protein
MSLDGTTGDGENDNMEQVSDIGDEGLFSGTKIDSEEEALASSVAIEPTATVNNLQGALYTLDMWRVKPGQQADFIAAWQALGNIFQHLPQPPAGKGTLIQSVSDPALFYSIGSWVTLADIEAMRNDAEARARLETLRQYCTEAETEAYLTVSEVPLP